MQVNVVINILYNYMKLCALLPIIAILVFFNSCGKKNDPTRDTIELLPGELNAISAHSAINVNYTRTDGSPKVTISCKKLYTSSLDVHMDGSTLVAKFRRGAAVPATGIQINVASPTLRDITATSAATVSVAKNTEFPNDLTITLSSAGSVNANHLKCDKLTLVASEASQIELRDLNCHDITASASSSALILLDGNAGLSCFMTDTGGEIRHPELNVSGSK